MANELQSLSELFQMGVGVYGAIFKDAGALELQAVCDKLAPIRIDEAVITPGFGLMAKYVIHAADPVYRHWNKDLLGGRRCG